MVALCNRETIYIFMLWFVLLSSFFFFFSLHLRNTAGRLIVTWRLDHLPTSCWKQISHGRINKVIVDTEQNFG